jgi:hypothetical protein
MGMVSMATSSTVVIRRIDERELDGILSTIGASLAADGFVPKGNVSGLFVFEKKKEPNILVALGCFSWRSSLASSTSSSGENTRSFRSR